MPNPNDRAERAERRLCQLALETQRMLSTPPDERAKQYGTEGPRLVLQALRNALDTYEATP